MNKSQTEAGMKLTFDFNNMMESAIGSQGIKEKELELLEEKAIEAHTARLYEELTFIVYQSFKSLFG